MRGAARQHSRVDAGRAAAATAADDAAAALLAVKADVSGALAAEPAEGLSAEADGVGLAVEGLTGLLECEEALPADEPAGARGEAAGSAALPSLQAKPERHLGWKVYQRPISGPASVFHLLQLCVLSCVVPGCN